MWNEPRNWKWMVPGFAFVGCAVGGAWLLVQQYDWLAAIVLGFGLICFLAAVFNAWAWVQSHGAEVFSIVQAAKNSTPEVRKFEAAKVMHPEAVRALLAHQRMVWRIRYVPVRDLVEWVLDDAPSVKATFVEFVLDYSSESSVMPKSMLSDGSKQFDAEGIVTDYEQYDSLLLLFQQKMMCTQAFGNQPPKWIAPWTPELLRHRFGLDVGDYQAEGTEMLKAVERARAYQEAPLNVNGKLVNADKVN